MACCKRIGAWLACLAVATTATSFADSASPTRFDAPIAEPNRGPSLPIESGVVIDRGHYVGLPYRVELVDGQIVVNGRSFGRPDILGQRGPRMGPPAGFRGGMRRGGLEPVAVPSTHTLVEESLLRDAALVRFEDGSSFVFRNGHAILDLLSRNESVSDKVSALTANVRQRATLAQWGGLVERFEPNAEVHERVAAHHAAFKAAFPNAAVAEGAEASDGWIYATTVLGMVLAVGARGGVLGQRPTRGWRGVNTNPEALRLVWSSAALVLLLAAFDLTLTLSFSESAGFREVNPIGRAWLGDPAVLSSLKLLVTGSSVGILLALAKYRAAQLASWWACLGMALLTARWVAFNSMFLS